MHCIGVVWLRTGEFLLRFPPDPQALMRTAAVANRRPQPANQRVTGHTCGVGKMGKGGSRAVQADDMLEQAFTGMLHRDAKVLCQQSLIMSSMSGHCRFFMSRAAMVAVTLMACALLWH